MRRVVVSGIGLVSPLGTKLELFWDALLTGRPGVSAVTRFDASSFPCRVAGQVDDAEYEDLVDARLMRTTTHVTRMSLAAVELAVADGRMRAGEADPDLLGVAVGTAMAGLREAEQQHGIFMERGARRVNPFVVSGSPSHGTAAEIAAKLQARGSHHTFANGCPASLQAIAHASSLVSSGDLDVCLAGGGESPLMPTNFAALTRTQELSTLNDDPHRASRPFDREHAGMVLSEGACFLVLEPRDRALARGARIYAEILGSASSCDASGMYNLDMAGETGARAIHRALAQSGLGVGDIDYVCAHANSSPAFDRKEVAVLKKAFGEFAAKIPVSSIKGVLGHPFGASGAFQTAAAALAIRNQVIPPTHNLENPDPECDLDCVPGQPRKQALRTALVTSYGYGGVNSYLLLREAEL
jgi:3-oxoacyl-[acyl-carrier-protein] synthase II